MELRGYWNTSSSRVSTHVLNYGIYIVFFTHAKYFVFGIKILLEYSFKFFCYLILNISVCACIPTVKKHVLISEGVLIFECFV